MIELDGWALGWVDAEIESIAVESGITWSAATWRLFDRLEHGSYRHALTVDQAESVYDVLATMIPSANRIPPESR